MSGSIDTAGFQSGFFRHAEQSVAAAEHELPSLSQQPHLQLLQRDLRTEHAPARFASLRQALEGQLAEGQAPLGRSLRELLDQPTGRDRIHRALGHLGQANEQCTVNPPLVGIQVQKPAWKCESKQAQLGAALQSVGSPSQPTWIVPGPV
jgi:hypothetical protein